MSDAPEYRCFVGGLSWSTSDRTLEDAFHKFGHLIEAKVVVDRDTGRSRGFGFVTFDDKKSMEDAIDSMHGMSLDGRSITVDRARPKSDGEDRDRGDRGYGGGRGYSGGGGGGGGGSSECFKCGQRGHFARECPNGDGYRGGGGDRYGSRSDRYGGGSRSSSKYGSDRNGDRYGGRSRDGGGSRSGKDSDRYNRDRSGPYDRPSGGGTRSYDDRD